MAAAVAVVGGPYPKLLPLFAGGGAAGAGAAAADDVGCSIDSSEFRALKMLPKVVESLGVVVAALDSVEDVEDSTE